MERNGIVMARNARKTRNQQSEVENMEQVTINETLQNNALTSVTEKMRDALRFNEESAYETIERKDGTSVDIVKKVYKFAEPMGSKSQLTVMDIDMIRSLDTIQGAIGVRKMSNYIICKEFSKINESGKLESFGFKTIGELGKAIFGLETSTVNHYARIGQLFITDDYQVNPMLPELSVSHLLELSSYCDGDVEKISELYQTGVLVDGMSTKKIRETLKNLRENALEDKGEQEDVSVEDSNNNDVSNDSNLSSSENGAEVETSSEPTQETVEQLKAQFDKQVIVGKMFNYCEVIEEMFKLLIEHDIEIVDYDKPIETIKAMIQAIL